MKRLVTNRRLLLGGLVSLPMAFVFGRDWSLFKAADAASPLSPRASLKKLALLLGPWRGVDREEAEDFASRFVAAKHAVRPYFPEASQLIQSLASRFPASTIATKEINLSDLNAKEKELLIALVKQLYSFVEVRFIVSDKPPWGACLGDGMWHTRAPKAH